MTSIHEFHEHLKEETANAGDVDDATNIATQQLTTGLAFALPIDNSKPNAFEAWMSVQPKVLDFLNTLNEKFMVDYSTIIDNIKGLYIKRWNLAFQPENQVDAVNTMVNQVTEQSIPAQELSVESLSIAKQGNIIKLIQMAKRGLGV